MMWNGSCPLWNAGAWGTWGWAGMILNMLVWVALLVGVIYLVVWMVRRSGLNRPLQESAAPLSAREIARLRYARGEIDREAYLKLIEDIEV